MSSNSKFAPVQITPLPLFLLGMEQSFVFYQHNAHTSEAYLKRKAHLPCLGIQQTVNK